MQGFYEMYQRGYHQQVYEELFSMQGNIYASSFYANALAVTREIMRRVRYNIEQLVVRLNQVGYLFGKAEGSFREDVEKNPPFFRPPTSETAANIAMLEMSVGSLPLSLRCWYEEVGSVNFIGLFPKNERKDGPDLDPLYIEPLESLLQIIQRLTKAGVWEGETELILAPDAYHKYGYSGAGSYNISFPCERFDTLLINEPHNTTFINYLRICLQSGGFSGLGTSNLISQEILMYLTKDLYLF